MCAAGSRGDNARADLGVATLTTLQRQALVPHSTEQMFTLVADVAGYSRHFDWCLDGRVLERRGAIEIARLELRVAGLAFGLTTRNTLEAPHRLSLELVEGPLERLEGAWSFRPLGATACLVALNLRFTVARSGWVAGALGVGLQRLADRLVDDFVQVAGHADVHS